jgi:hypothetical protein
VTFGTEFFGAETFGAEAFPNVFGTEAFGGEVSVAKALRVENLDLEALEASEPLVDRSEVSGVEATRVAVSCCLRRFFLKMAMHRLRASGKSTWRGSLMFGDLGLVSQLYAATITNMPESAGSC